MGNFARMCWGLVETDIDKKMTRKRGSFFYLALFFETVLDRHDQADEDQQNAAACEQPFYMGEQDQYPGEYNRLRRVHCKQTHDGDIFQQIEQPCASW